MLTIFITFGFLAVARCQQDCSTEWENQRKCMATERAQYAPKRLSDNDRNQIRASIRQCYARAGCRDPFLTDAQEAAMKNCSRDLRRSIKQDLKNCIGRSNYKDYNLPKDNDSQFGWGQDVARIKRKDQKCQPSKGKEKEFGQCLQQALKQQFQQRQQSKPTDPCESRYKCYQQWEHENCYNRERDAKRQVCACVKSANLEKYKNDYRSCLRSKNVPVDDADFNLMTVDKLANKYCNGTKDPCGGYNGRQSQLRSSNKNSNNNNNNNRGNNWNNNNNRGNGNQGNNWNNNNNNQGSNWNNNNNNQGSNWNNNNNNQGSNWNNNNNQNGNNWNANSNTDNTGSDLNTYDLDTVDGDTSGGFPDVGSVLSSGGDGGGGDLSSVLGSANTGLDPSTFFGGGALSGGGLAGNPLGALGGGLFSGFGGAGGTDIFSQFSSGLDPSALFSGIGKKKK